MYHISRKQFREILRQHSRKIDVSVADRTNSEPYPLNAMDDNIGSLYRPEPEMNKRYLTPNGINCMCGLIDKETVLMIPMLEYANALDRHKDEIWIERIEGDDEEECEEDEYSYLDSSEVLATWIEHNPLNFVWAWLGDRP